MVKHIWSTFISSRGTKQINIDGKLVQQLRLQIASNLETQNMETFIFDSAQTAVIDLMETDIYPQFIRSMTIRLNLKTSRQLAIWCFAPPSLVEFFSFPNPIIECDSRLHSICNCIQLLFATSMHYFFNVKHLYAVITIGYLLRAMCGPRLDPQAFFVLFVLSPLFGSWFGSEYVPGPPRRFAQFVGFVFSALGTVLVLTGNLWTGWAVFGFLFVVSFVAGVFNWCLACVVFRLMIKAKIVPKVAEKECQLQYISKNKVGSGMFHIV